jgi:hypothetical protein
VDAQREVTHFKSRVLDLVDIFVKKQPSSAHIVRLILPLVELTVGTGIDERQLSDKAKGILRSRIGKLKEIPSSVDTELATKVLGDLHTRAQKVHSSDILATLSQCSIYLSKVIFHSASEAPVLQVYRRSLSDFIIRKNSAFHASFFQDFIRRYPTVAWNIRKDLIELSGKAVNVYRQCQAFQLLHALIVHLSSVVSFLAIPYFILLSRSLGRSKRRSHRIYVLISERIVRNHIRCVPREGHFDGSSIERAVQTWTACDPPNKTDCFYATTYSFNMGAKLLEYTRL